MKVFIGKERAVTVSEGGERHELKGGPFTWGKKDQALITTSNLAKAILLDLLGEELLVERLYIRFKWRTCATWPDAWAYTADELLGVVKAIQETETSTAQTRAMVSNAVAPVVSDAGGGDIPAAPVEWKSSGDVGVVRPGKKG